MQYRLQLRVDLGESDPQEKSSPYRIGRVIFVNHIVFVTDVWYNKNNK